MHLHIYIHWHFEAAFVFPPLGITPTEPCRAFKEFLYQSLVRQTPLHEQTHSVVLKITSGVREYSLDCIQKLRRGKLDAALDVIRELFDQSRPLPMQIQPPRGALLPLQQATTLAICMWQREVTVGEESWQ